MGFVFRVSCFGFRGSVSKFLISGFGVWVSGFRFQISGFGVRISDFGFRIPDFGFHVSGFRLRILGLEVRISDFRFRVSDFGFRGSGSGSNLSGGAPPQGSPGSSHAPHHLLNPPCPWSHSPEPQSPWSRCPGFRRAAPWLPRGSVRVVNLVWPSRHKWPGISPITVLMGRVVVFNRRDLYRAPPNSGERQYKPRTCITRFDPAVRAYDRRWLG